MPDSAWGRGSLTEFWELCSHSPTSLLCLPRGCVLPLRWTGSFNSPAQIALYRAPKETRSSRTAKVGNQEEDHSLRHGACSHFAHPRLDNNSHSYSQLALCVRRGFCACSPHEHTSSGSPGLMNPYAFQPLTTPQAHQALCFCSKLSPKAEDRAGIPEPPLLVLNPGSTTH